jgi:hypothetical protein
LLDRHFSVRGMARPDGGERPAPAVLEGTFTAMVSEIGNKVPGFGTHLIVELEDEGVIFEAPPFNLGVAELDHPIRFSLQRPK